MKIRALLVFALALAGCEFEAIDAPATAHVDEAFSVTLTIGDANNEDATEPWSLCMQLPTGWTLGTISYTYDTSVSSGTITSANTDDASAAEVSFHTDGYAWQCFNAPSPSAVGDRGHATFTLTPTSSGAFVLGFQTWVHNGDNLYRFFASHTISVDSVPFYDANPLPIVSATEPANIAIGNGIIVAQTDDAEVITTTDGTSPQSYTIIADAEVSGIAFGAGLFVAVGGSGFIATAADGATWTQLTAPTASNLLAIVRADHRFVVVGQHGTILVSPDGLAWTDTSLGSVTADLNHVASGGGHDVDIGSDGSTLLVAPSDGHFSSVTLSGVSYSGKLENLAYAPRSGWVFALGSYTHMQSMDLVSAVGTGFTNSTQIDVLGGADYVYLSSSPQNSLLRLDGTTLIDVGSNTSWEIQYVANDGQRMVFGGLGAQGTQGFLTVDLPRLSITAGTDTGLTQTITVTNRGRGQLYVTGAAMASSVNSVGGCANAVLSTNDSCALTVTLVNTIADTLTVTSNGAIDGTATLILQSTVAPPTEGSGDSGDTDDTGTAAPVTRRAGCAALPTSSLAALVAASGLMRWASSRRRMVSNAS